MATTSSLSPPCPLPAKLKHCRCAAGLAKELAKLKISSRLTEQEESDDRSQSQSQQSNKKCSAPVKLVK